MVFMLPSEFMAPDDDCEEQDSEEAMAQLNLEPIPATFEKLEDEKRKHLKALFLKGFVDGKPVTKMLVDGGAAVNIIPYAMLRKLGKGSEDLTKTDMMLKDFEGVVSLAVGALCVDLTIGSKTLPTTFSSLMGRGHIVCCWEEIGFMPIVAYHLLCINALYNGLAMLLKLLLPIRHSVLHRQKPVKKAMRRWDVFPSQAWETEFLKIADYKMSLSSAAGSADES